MQKVKKFRQLAFSYLKIRRAGIKNCDWTELKSCIAANEAECREAQEKFPTTYKDCLEKK
jgi:hypothetical protein